MEIGLGKNTLVWMADGSFKKVISLKKGDLVDTFEGPAYVELVLAHRYSGTLYEYANVYMAPMHRIYDSGAMFDVTHAGSDLVLEEYNDFVYNIAVSNRSSVRVGYDTDQDIKANKGLKEYYIGTLGNKELFDRYFWGTENIIANIKEVDDESIGYIVCEKPIVTFDDAGRVDNITF